MTISGRRAAMFQMFQRVVAQISAVCRHAMDLLEELSSVPTSLSPPLIPFCTWLCGQSWNLTKRAAVQFTGQGKKKSRLLLMFAPRRKSHLFDAASDQWIFVTFCCVFFFWLRGSVPALTSQAQHVNGSLFMMYFPLLLPFSPPRDVQAPAAQTARPPPPPCGGATGTGTRCATPAAFTSNCTM